MQGVLSAQIEHPGDYDGPMPDRAYYDPDGMSAKKKSEFERWYTKKVDANYRFVMRREVEA